MILLVQDTTDIDLWHRRKISGVGQIGNERGRGFFVQTVLAVRPEIREVLGCMAQEPFVRIPAHAGEQRHQRLKRENRETDVWMGPACTALGHLMREASGSMSEIGALICSRSAQACQTTKTHFLVRAAQNRRVEQDEEEIKYSLDRARAFASQASRPFEVPARHGHKARLTHLQLA